MAEKKERKLDIFAVMRRFDNGDKTVFSSVRADQAQAAEFDSFVGYPALRWMSSSADEIDSRYCLEAAEIANLGYFALGKHRQLQSKLLAALGARKRIRHEWIAPPKSSKEETDGDVDLILTVWPHLKPDEIKLWLKVNGKEGITELRSRLGQNNKN